MYLSKSDIVNILNELVMDIKNDFIETTNDEYIELRRRIYNAYYDVSILSNTSPQVIAFVDGGFKLYQLDVSIIIPLQIGAYIRVNDDSRLRTVTDLLNKPITDTILLYSSRRRENDKYKFKIKIRSLQKTNLLFDKDNPVDEATRKINNLISEISGLSESKAPKFFMKLTKYIEGLLELAYTIKLLMKLDEENPLDQKVSYAVLDGTLIKWFSIKTQKKFKDIDGLDILAAILNTETYKIKDYLFRIVGLAKTTKFTNIIRSQTLFLSKINEEDIYKENSYGAYTLINIDSLHSIRDKLNSFLEKYRATKFINETLYLFNRIVYNVHNIYVARFPITTDFHTIFMLDIHIDRPIIWFDEIRDKGVNVNIDYAKKVNPYVSYVVSTLCHKRSPNQVRTPAGYMDVDQLVRFTEPLRSFFEEMLIQVLSKYDDLTFRILRQVFTSTVRMRYGYR